MSNNVEINNSEILIIYEAKLCNPNGDPDNENRPRFDYKTETNLVSDVRLKRFFRDYIIDRFGEKYVWVSKVEGKHVSAEQKYNSLKVLQKEESEKGILEIVKKQCIDARLFGATIPIKGKGGAEKGKGETLIGPVQFSWGFSLHKVDMVDSSTISSIFRGREGEEVGVEAGTFGKDWRVYYSLIAFYGVVSGNRAKNADLREKDIRILDEYLWKALQIQATTRSKIGEKPHLYLRIEYNDRETLIGDLRKYIKVEYKDPVRNFEDLKIDLGPLLNVMEDDKFKNRISKIYIYSSEEMKAYCVELFKKFKDRLVKIPSEEPTEKIELTEDLLVLKD